MRVYGNESRIVFQNIFLVQVLSETITDDWCCSPSCDNAAGLCSDFWIQKYETCRLNEETCRSLEQKHLVLLSYSYLPLSFSDTLSCACHSLLVLGRTDHKMSKETELFLNVLSGTQIAGLRSVRGTKEMIYDVTFVPLSSEDTCQPDFVSEFCVPFALFAFAEQYNRYT